ncbi:hypothetical protein D3C87_2047670 [compost metagenome]
MVEEQGSLLCRQMAAQKPWFQTMALNHNLMLMIPGFISRETKEEKKHLKAWILMEQMKGHIIPLLM